MARSKATAQNLRDLALTLKNEQEKFMQVKSAMDGRLSEIYARWQDPVQARFQVKYQETITRIEQNLIPALAAYQQHLYKEAFIIGIQYAEE